MSPKRRADATSASGDKGSVDRIGILNALFERAHVSIWACDSNGMVVLWNPGAESLYGLTFAQTQAAPYWELFVDEKERDQAEIDTAKIIEHGEVFTNQLAYDTSKAGTQRHMLTNCFRVTDPITGDRYLAEIGVEISDLELRKREHNTLREVGSARLALQKNNLVLRTEAIAESLREFRSECWALVRKLRAEWQDFRDHPSTPEHARAITAAKLERLEQNWKVVRSSIKALEVERAGCIEDHELADLEERVEDFDPRSDLMEGLR